MKYAKLSCHPELVSGSCLSMKKEEALNKSSFRAPLRSGFTLIELLVVVLIIGILAAVAVPQYQVAVMKSRLMALVPTVKAMKQAAETYYLANGSYVNDIYAYDVEYPSCANLRRGHCRTKSNVIFDIYTSNSFCEDVAGVLMNEGYGDAILSYGFCLDHSARPGVNYCAAQRNNEVANSVCVSMGGILQTKGGACIATGNKNACSFYVLP